MTITMESKEIDFYEKEANEDLTCPIRDGQLDISGYSVRLGMLRAKWATYLYKEETIQNETQQELNSIYSDRWMYYNYDYEYNVDKKDIPVLIKGSKEFREAEAILNSQIEKVKFINEVLSALNSQSFYLSTAMKHILWKSGETA